MKRPQDPFSKAGILLAPLAVIPAAALHLALWHWNPGRTVGALYEALVLVPLAYFLALFVGVPYLYGLRRLGLLNAAAVAGGALFLGLIVGFLIGVILFPLWDWYARFFYLSLGGISGLAVGLVYWLIFRLVRTH